MSTKFNEQMIRDMINGAALYGAGGGGSPQNGYDMLEKFKDAHPDKPVEITVIPASEMAAGHYAGVVAGMGSPDAIVGLDFTPYVVNTYDLLVDMAAESGRTLSYTLPVELGGFNTFIPMLISLLQNKPFIDADGCGRAVPALTTLLFAINGLDTSPLAMANDRGASGDQVRIKLADPKDAQTAEDVGRGVAVAFGGKSGLAGWLVTGDQIISALPRGTITKARAVGELMRTSDMQTIFTQINSSITPARALTSGICTRKDVVPGPCGFDVGIVEITDGDNQVWQILFQNENLVVFKGNDEDKVPVMTAPDIIAAYDSTSGDCLSNADIRLNQHIAMGLMKVDAKWWDVGEAAMNQVWRPFFDNVGYCGDIIRFENTPI